MKKRISLALIFALCTVNLVACGGTGSDQQTLEQRSEEATTADAQTVDEAKETRETENLEIMASEENMTDITLDSLLTHPDDDTYFKPETNDWLITVKIRNDYDPAKRVMERPVVEVNCIKASTH